MRWPTIAYGVVLVFCAGALALNVMVWGQVWWGGVLDLVTAALGTCGILGGVAVVVNLWQVERNWPRCTDLDRREIEICKGLLRHEADLLRQQVEWQVETQGAELGRLLTVLRQSNREFTAQGLVAVARTALQDD